MQGQWCLTVDSKKRGPGVVRQQSENTAVKRGDRDGLLKNDWNSRPAELRVSGAGRTSEPEQKAVSQRIYKSPPER